MLNEQKSQVKDIMSTPVIFVGPDTKVPSVSALLTNHSIHGVPVVDRGGIVGIITESDFFIRDYPDIYLPSYIDFIKKTKFKNGADKDRKQETKKLLNATAKDIMSKNCVTISDNESVEELINIYKTSSLYTIPVVDQENKLVGIVTQADIIKFINV